MYELETHFFIKADQLESESDIDPESNPSFKWNFLPDPTLDASILGSEIRLGESKIGRNLNFDAYIYT